MGGKGKQDNLQRVQASWLHLSNRGREKNQVITKGKINGFIKYSGAIKTEKNIKFGRGLNKPTSI